MILLGALLPLLILAAFALLFAWFGNMSYRVLEAQRSLVQSGTLAGVEYGCYEESYTTRTGALVHTTHHHTRLLDATIIRFYDGRTCVMDGHQDMPYPIGTSVAIDEDGNGRRHIRAL